jgi:flagellar biosynthesis protein FlhB
MSSEDDGKTEKPTGKRLGDAREKGDVVQSPEVKLWASLLCAFIIVTMLATRMAHTLLEKLAPLIDHPQAIRIRTPQDLAHLFAQLGLEVGLVLAIPFALIIAVSLAAMIAQTRGLMWVPDKLMPDFKRLNPAMGFKRLFSPTIFVELGKQLLKIAVVGALLLWIVHPHIREFQGLTQLDLVDMMQYIQDRLFSLLLAVVIVSTLITAADYAYQNWRFIDRLKMTRQELRDENKQTEGDPLVKGKLRSIRVRRARQRMMQAVPKATVVVTNPTHFAVALRYDMDSMGAPVLVAKGADLVAKRIRDLAEQHDIPVVENPPLARALYATVELDGEIPPEHYKAVAEVISYVMRLKGKLAH